MESKSASEPTPATSKRQAKLHAQDLFFSAYGRCGKSPVGCSTVPRGKHT